MEWCLILSLNWGCFLKLVRLWSCIGCQKKRTANLHQSQPIASRPLALDLPMVGLAAHRQRSARCLTRTSALAFSFSTNP